ncbi:hypothetical protein [Panacagrimonas sp.]|uniref:hypothetical protein n=1 Tax=Panacagrimonas sp. TaxID=2480088 RepID=UPI003B529BCB
MRFKKTFFVAALALASFSAQAAPVGGGLGQAVPRLLTSLGVIANPLLQPVLSISGPIVGGLVQNATPSLFLLLGNVGAGPINALLVRTPSIGGQRPGLFGRSLDGAPARALPPLPGLR